MTTTALPLTALLLFSVGLSAAQEGSGQNLTPGAIRYTQFTTHPADERHVAWSPDGKWIAFHSDRGDNTDLWVKPATGGADIRVTDAPADDRSPSWSPDGTRLLFVSNRGGHSNLWTISPLEGEATATRITADTDSVSGSGFSDGWSPDGTQIVYVANRGRHNHLWVIPASGGVAKRLSTTPREDWDPDWSPDGKWIAYNSAPHVGAAANIWIVPSGGGTPRQMTTSLCGDFNPSWSPDGQWIAFARKAGHALATWEIWILPAAGGTPAQVTNTPKHVTTGPRWSPDGTRIAFYRSPIGRGLTSDIWIVDVSDMLPFLSSLTHQRVAGQVTRASDGTRWAHIPIHVRDAAGAVVKEATTSADGRYQVWLNPGSYSISVGLVGIDEGAPPVEVSLEVGENRDGVDFVPGADTSIGVPTDSLFCGALRKLSTGRLVSDGELGPGLPADETRILRNSVFARHGRPFSSSELQYYFYARGSKPCGVEFQESQSYSDDMLSGEDELNIKTLLALQAAAEVLASPRTSDTPVRTGDRTPVHLEQLQGEWLNKTYLEALEKTKSPGRAYSGPGPSTRLTAFYISREHPAYFDWKQSLSYHEGVFSRITGLQPTGAPNTFKVLFYHEQTHGPVTHNDRLRVADGAADTLTWIFEPAFSSMGQGEQQIDFIRLRPGIDTFVNRTVLAGRYRNEDGQEFVFEESGQAVWPDMSFEYSVSLDKFGIVGEHDWFTRPGGATKGWNPKTVYSFEWRHGKLLIFATDPIDPDMPADPAASWIRREHPLHVLTPEPNE